MKFERTIVMAWTPVADESDMLVQDFKCFIVDDMEITVYHLDDGFYATSDTCTHEDCSLSQDGEIEKHEIICTCHGGAFDIKTGKATRMPCVSPIETFPVRCHNGRIEVDID